MTDFCHEGSSVVRAAYRVDAGRFLAVLGDGVDPIALVENELHGLIGSDQVPSFSWSVIVKMLGQVNVIPWIPGNVLPLWFEAVVCFAEAEVTS